MHLVIPVITTPSGLELPNALQQKRQSDNHKNTNQKATKTPNQNIQVAKESQNGVGGN